MILRATKLPFLRIHASPAGIFLTRAGSRRRIVADEGHILFRVGTIRCPDDVPVEWTTSEPLPGHQKDAPARFFH